MAALAGESSGNESSEDVPRDPKFVRTAGDESDSDDSLRSLSGEAEHEDPYLVPLGEEEEEEEEEDEEEEEEEDEENEDDEGQGQPRRRDGQERAVRPRKKRATVFVTQASDNDPSKPDSDAPIPADDQVGWTPGDTQI